MVARSGRFQLWIIANLDHVTECNPPIGACSRNIRNVDAECQVEITQLYMLEEKEDTEDA